MIAGGQLDCTGKTEAERDRMERRLIETFFRLMGKQNGGEVSILFPPEGIEARLEEVIKEMEEDKGKTL